MNSTAHTGRVPTRTLGDCGEWLSGGTPAKANPSFWLGDIPWISAKSLTSFRLSASDDCVTRVGAEDGSQLVPPGTILFVVRGMSLAREFKVGVAAREVAFNQDVKAIRPAEDVDSFYLAHFLKAAEAIVLGMCEESSHGTKRLPTSTLASLPVPLPPLAEQRRIASILDKADALRAKRRAALAQLDALTQAIFLDMFGDPVTNPKGWPVEKLDALGTLDRGVSKHRPRNAPELLGGKYPLIQTGEVANCGGYLRDYRHTYSELGLSQSKIWPAGTLCITIAANIAKTGILMFDACFPDSIVGFQAKDACTAEYVRTWLSFLQKTLEDNAPEFAQKNINLAILRALDVPVPPLASRQLFAERVTALGRLQDRYQASLASLDALFASLQHRAFRGEL